MIDIHRIRLGSPSLDNFTEVRSPRLFAFSNGLAFDIASVKVIGTVVTGTDPTVKIPDNIIFWDLNSAIETSTCGLFKHWIKHL